MTTKRYYEDAYIKTADIAVVQSGVANDGRPYVILDETIFYPTGGGQPHDTGKIGNVTVVDVEEVEGELRHFLNDIPAFQTGDRVSIELDWTRRFDHMQQHAGQHILTASIVELFDVPTVSFHLGSEIVTIDLQTESLSDEQLTEIEQRANEIIIENRPIETKWVTKDELSNYPLRKQVSVEENIRLVIIPEFDYNGCGGTHPSSTGQVQMIQLLGTEKQKGNTRLHFVCGNRVRKKLHQKHQLLKSAVQQLSVPEEEVPTAVQTVLHHQRQLEKQRDELKQQLLELEGSVLLTQLPQEEVVITKSFEGKTMKELQVFAKWLLQDEQSQKYAFIFVTKNDSLLQFVLAKGNEVEFDIESLSKKALELLNGKGGGKGSVFQGGGEWNGTAAEFLKELQK